MEFRDLKADEIEVRVAQVGKGWCSVLLYKDARVDQNILDETVGCMNWQRKHLRDNANCIVSIWNEDIKQWIEKEDTGKESFTEKEKGLASDSFKRACFNWGIGRELYTAPKKMFITLDEKEYYVSGKDNKGKDKYAVSKKIEFHVEKIAIENKRITGIRISDNNNKARYSWKQEG